MFVPGTAVEVVTYWVLPGAFALVVTTLGVAGLVTFWVGAGGGRAETLCDSVAVVQPARKTNAPTTAGPVIAWNLVALTAAGEDETGTCCDFFIP